MDGWRLIATPSPSIPVPCWPKEGFVVAFISVFSPHFSFLNIPFLERRSATEQCVAHCVMLALPIDFAAMDNRAVNLRNDR